MLKELLRGLGVSFKSPEGRLDSGFFLGVQDSQVAFGISGATVQGLGFLQGLQLTTVDDINPALPIIRNIRYRNSHSLGSFR